jgi:hypothetical protein
MPLGFNCVNCIEFVSDSIQESMSSEEFPQRLNFEEQPQSSRRVSRRVLLRPRPVRPIAPIPPSSHSVHIEPVIPDIASIQEELRQDDSSLKITPPHDFQIIDPNRPADHGPVVPAELIPRGRATGKVRRTILSDHSRPDNTVALPFQVLIRNRITQVESLYVIPSTQIYFWKIYTEEEVIRLTRNTNNFEYRIFRR